MNKRAKRGDTALHFAVNVDSTKFLEVLLAHPKLDLHAKNSKGETALDMANKSYHEHHVVLLEEALKDPSKFQANYVAAGARVLNEVGGSNVELQGRSTEEPSEEKPEVRPEEKPEVRSEEKPEVRSKEKPEVRSEEKPEVRKASSTLASMAEASQAMEVKEFLVAAFNGNLGRMMNLLKGGVSLNVSGSGEMLGRTALHLAALKGHLHVLKFLLEKDGIKVNKQNKSGNTALHFAVKSGNPEAVEMLLGHPGVDPNIKNGVSDTLPVFYR